MTERSGFLTFVAILYGLNAASATFNLFFSLLGSLFMLIISPLVGAIYLGIDVISAAALAILITFVVKVWRVAPDLKRWTDIVHLVGTVMLTLFLIGTLALPSTVAQDPTFAELLELDPTEPLTWMYYLAGFIAFALLVEIAFWVGIRTHLARLERDGKATFTKGLFNSTSA